MSKDVCATCTHYDVCMERRGRCKDYQTYEDIKEKVRKEIEELRKNNKVI